MEQIYVKYPRLYLGSNRLGCQYPVIKISLIPSEGHMALRV